MVTISDVAKRAGVSKTTVSHALSGKRPVAYETRIRIEQVIAELDFHPNMLARSLRMQRTQMVALIIPDITNPFYPVLARGLQDALMPHGYYVILCNTEVHAQQEIAIIKEAVYRQVDGIALASLYNRTRELQEFITNTVPFLSFGQSIVDPHVDLVATDDRAGVKDAIDYLVQRGHRRIALLAGTHDFTPSQARTAGYLAALQEAGLASDDSGLIIECSFTRAGGAQGMRELLARFSQHSLAQRPTAIFCSNDLIAIGAMDVAHEIGLAIPADIAIVGYDDIEVASLLSPPLTTIAQPAYEIGKTAGQLLLGRMQKTYNGPGRQVIVPHHFIKRASA